MEIHIQIKIAGDGFPTPEELDLRHELEDWIEDNGVGVVVDAGAGGGVMDIFIEPSDTKALFVVQQVIAERGLGEIATVKTLDDKTLDDKTPDKA